MDYLAACTTVKNEGRYIYEWLSYHHALGVEHFYIYNNDSDDDTLDEIKRWPRPEAVTVIDWPGSRVQHLAYEHMAQEFRGESEWCAFIDADEFLCPQEDNAIPDILDYFSPQCSAVFAHWMLFGSSGYIERTPGLVTETFLRRGHDDFDPNKVGKTIVRLSQAIETDGVHVMRSAGRMINDSGEAVDQACQGIHSSISHRFISLNHYFTKSLNEWRVRRALGRATQEPGLAEFRRSEHDFTSHDVNDVIDLRAAQIMEKCRGLYY
jgi:glycosyltransferase involved in cell wall biosynthesis